MERTRQLLLTLILFGPLFSGALDLKPADFQRVLNNRPAVLALPPGHEGDQPFERAFSPAGSMMVILE